ncbi:Protein cordon-bleu [Galemys pyrenaicus]|uniref:Protein cordon-bleu n=1 Tax=Galemys pyrenaicus TaxID=202257 RepID=A0A8J6A4P3_GALPY|nr:Protein cordon-bleu [Galemys pyrenaicus]
MACADDLGVADPGLSVEWKAVLRLEKQSPGGSGRSEESEMQRDSWNGAYRGTHLSSTPRASHVALSVGFRRGSELDSGAELAAPVQYRGWLGMYANITQWFGNLRKMKARAPPPPGKPTSPSMHSEKKPPRDVSPGPQQNLLTMKEQLQKSVVDITVVLPSGMAKKSVVNGSHAMMDLLVELCLQYHLNPSHHTLEIWSSETEQPLNYKPNTLVGMLDVHTVFLKEKVPEEKIKTSLSKVPEKSVLLIVNYLRTQKAVMRVSPKVPLQTILPAICAKCEVSPEHVVLLRDNVTWQELELSKSLNELGIKELYAWDNKRETFRKSSLGNDEAEKEKKKILGLFKVNKRSNSKVEQLGLSGVDSDEDTSKSALGSLNGYLTTPNSPSLKSRSITLGTSLSLSNISGVSVKSDMKKRRAPLPPSLPSAGTSSAGTPMPDRASEKMSLGSQIDLQKKKRRAPAPPPPQPPPPSPLVPNRGEDSEEKRKSAMGIGRQVPQKPPRGTARGPPHLVLPPPPPYPPPDTDVAEPLSSPGEGAGAEASDLRPTHVAGMLVLGLLGSVGSQVSTDLVLAMFCPVTLPLDSGGVCSTDGVPPVLSEAEETVSVGSCFASEDTTEDSGVMSSPSDIISLDSQHDTMKCKDKWATEQDDYSDQDLAATPELGPQKSPSWERKGSRNWNPRFLDKCQSLEPDSLSKQKNRDSSSPLRGETGPACKEKQFQPLKEEEKQKIPFLAPRQRRKEASSNQTLKRKEKLKTFVKVWDSSTVSDIV